MNNRFETKAGQVVSQDRPMRSMASTDLESVAERTQAVLDAGRFQPQDEDGLERLARRYYFSMALPASYYPKKYEDRWTEWAIEQGVSRAYIAMLDGAAIGVHPSMAIRQIHVINGVPTMSADLMFGRLLATGILRRDDFSVVASKTECILTLGITTRKLDTRMTIVCKYEDFKHLHSKDNWRNDPEAMLVARAKSRAVRRYAPDLLVGVYSTEEMRDARESAAAGVYEVPAEFMPGAEAVQAETPIVAPPKVAVAEPTQEAPMKPLPSVEELRALRDEIKVANDSITEEQITALWNRVRAAEGHEHFGKLVAAFQANGFLNPAQVAP